MSDNEMIVGVVLIVFSALTTMTWLVVRQRAGKLGGGAVRLAREDADRLARIEQAVDTIAVEVERVSEEQRFTARLLAGRAESQGPAARQPVGSSDEPSGTSGPSR